MLSSGCRYPPGIQCVTRTIRPKQKSNRNEPSLLPHVLRTVAVDWSDVHQLAENLSARHTEARGHRLADIMHVATALHLGAAEFLTFDAKQKILAEAEGLKVKV